MAEGMYEAQTGGFPSVAVPHSDLGAPYIIKPEDWYRMFEATGGVTGSILPEITKVTQAGTSLIDNAYNQQLEHQKAIATNAETLARGKYYDAEAQNISGQADLNLALKAQEVQRGDLNNKILGHTAQTSQWAMDDEQKALDDFGAWRDEIKHVDPKATDYDQKIADINARHPEASTNPTTQKLITPYIAQHNTTRSQDDNINILTNQLKTLQDPANAQYLPPGFKARETVQQGGGAAAIDAMNRQKITQQYQTVRPYASPTERTWIDNEITRLNGTTGREVGAENVSPDANMLTPQGALNPDSQANLAYLQNKYQAKAPPTKTVTTKQAETKTTPETTTTYTVPMSEAEQAQAQTPTAPPSVNMDVQQAMQGTKAWGWVAEQIQQNKIQAPPNQTPAEQNQWVAQQWLARMQATNEPIPKAVQDQIDRAKGPQPEPKPGETPVPPPQTQPTGKAQKPVRARRGVPLSEAGEETNLPNAYASATPPPAEGEATPVPVHLASETQVQGAPQPYTIPGDARQADWSNFKFGPATTFGLNYDGSIDQKDNGQGAMGHNTRDKRLVGASISVTEMQRTFGANVVRLQSDGSYKTDPQFAQAARNGDVQVQIVSPDGKMIQMPIVDVGPGASTHNRIDLTYAASHLFGTKGKTILGYQFVDRYGRPLTTG